MYLNSIDSSACVVVSYSCKTLFDYCDRRLFFSFPCNFSTKGQIQHVRKPKRHDIFFSILNYWFACLSSVSSPLFAKIFSLGNIILGISLNVQGFQTTVDQTVLNERVWWSTGIQQNQTHQKNRSFNFWSQSNFEFGYRTKWNKIKLSNSELLMASMLIYWSSVKAVKAILILVSFIISIFGVNSKINILRENVNAFVYQGKMF